MTPRVLLIGPPPGHLDEGMKNICWALASVLHDDFGIETRFVSLLEAIKNTGQYAWANILHYVGGPSYRSVLYMAWLGWRIPDVRKVISFTNPRWSALGDALIRLFPPDCAIVLSSQWQKWGEEAGIPTRLLPISGVDLNRFRSVSAERKRSLKQRLGFPTDRIIVLHVGHLNVGRNLDPLLCFHSHSDMQVVILASTTTEASAPLRERLESAGCIVRREFVPAVEEYYQAADCYVFPTVDTRTAIQIPLSVLEAMATNLPVVTTRFGGLPVFFAPGNGLCYVSDSQLLQLPAIVRSTVGSIPIQTRSLVQDFSWNNIARQLLSLYAELLRP